MLPHVVYRSRNNRLKIEPGITDIVSMRISSGLSVINFNKVENQKGNSERFYVWPVYGEGRVEKIHGVTRRTSSNITYAKPLPEDHHRLLGLANNSGEHEYNSSGRVQTRSPIPEPGSFFDAIV
jgi:hypothetical protein